MYCFIERTKMTSRERAGLYYGPDKGGSAGNSKSVQEAKVKPSRWPEVNDENRGKKKDHARQKRPR